MLERNGRPRFRYLQAVSGSLRNPSLHWSAQMSLLNDSSLKGAPPQKRENVWILMKHLNYVLWPLSLESSKPKPSINGLPRGDSPWPEMREWSMSSFTRGACTLPLSRLDPAGSRLPPQPRGWARLWRGTKEFQLVQVKLQWQLPSASPVLKRPLFETGYCIWTGEHAGPMSWAKIVQARLTHARALLDGTGLCDQPS